MESQNKWSIQPQGGLKDRMKSRNVNENKYRAHVKLAEFEQQLRATEKKYKFVKNRLDYMKKVYQSVRPAALESTVFNLPSDSSSNSILLHNCKIYHHDVSENMNKVDNANELDISGISNPEQNAESNANIFTVNHSKINENEPKRKNNSNQKNKNGKISRENECAAPLILKQSVRSSDDQNNTHDVIEPDEIVIMSPPATKSSEKSELISKIARANGSHFNENEVQNAIKSGKVTATAINSLSNVKRAQSKVDKIGTIRIMHVRKRKPRMRRTNSINTAASTPPIITYKNQFAQKNMNQVMPLDENSQLKMNNVAKVNIIEEKKTLDESWNEVVEIYHNTAAKNTSSSVVSSKQQFKLVELKSFESKDEPVRVMKVTTEGMKQNIPYSTNNIEEQDRECLRAEIMKNNCEPPDRDTTCRRNQRGLNALGVNQHHEDCQYSTTIHPWCCESIAVRNYQQPTISSKHKRINRCYISTQANLQNIPFIVGTSVTRSHNLGLNIQQVFSMMKHQQLTMAPDIKPALLRKVGEIIDPMISHTGQLMNDHGQEKRVMNSRQILRQETEQVAHIVSSKPPTKYGDSSKIFAHRTQSFLLRQREDELNMARDDFKKYQSVTNNSTRIRNVLHRMHDQLRRMNEEYKNLQIKVERTNDSSLRQELTALGNELTVKEEEMHAVIDLYKEIMELKRQMKVSREKKSVVCITTHSNRKHLTRIGPIISARGSRIPYHHLKTFNSQKLRIANGTREPMVGTRLAGFLRQIQSLQQQFTAT